MSASAEADEARFAYLLSINHSSDDRGADDQQRVVVDCIPVIAAVENVLFLKEHGSGQRPAAIKCIWSARDL